MSETSAAGPASPPRPGLWAALFILAMFGTGAASILGLLDNTWRTVLFFLAMGLVFGLGLVLVLGTVWGFLETFALAPHIWAWWAFPVWAIGMAASFSWSKVRGQ